MRSSAVPSPRAHEAISASEHSVPIPEGLRTSCYQSLSRPADSLRIIRSLDSTLKGWTSDPITRGQFGQVNVLALLIPAGMTEATLADTPRARRSTCSPLSFLSGALSPKGAGNTSIRGFESSLYALSVSPRATSNACAPGTSRIDPPAAHRAATQPAQAAQRHHSPKRAEASIRRHTVESALSSRSILPSIRDSEESPISDRHERALKS